MMFQSGQNYHCFPEDTPVYSQSITNLVDFTSQVAVKFNHFSRHPSPLCIKLLYFFLGPVVTSIHICSSPPPRQTVIFKTQI